MNHCLNLLNCLVSNMVLQVIRLLIPLTCTCPWSVWFCHLLEIYRVYIVRSLIYPRLRFLSWKIVDKCKQASCWSCKLPTNEDSANSVFFYVSKRVEYFPVSLLSQVYDQQVLGLVSSEMCRRCKTYEEFIFPEYIDSRQENDWSCKQVAF